MGIVEKSTKRHLFWLIMLVIFEIIVYGYLWNQKLDFHTDEYYTYQIANSSKGAYWVIPKNEWFTVSEFESQMSVSSEDRFDIARVVDAAKHDYHPFLYTLTIHLLCSFFPERFLPQIGFYLNVFFLILSTILIYFSGIIIYKHKREIFAISACLAFVFSHGVLQQVVFIRMYCMLIFLASAVIYLHIKYWENPNFTFFFLLFIVSVCGALTHYYFIPFLVFCFCFYFFVLLRAGMRNQIIKYCATEFSAGMVSLLVFPSMLSAIFDGTTESATVESVPFLQRLRKFFNLLDAEVFAESLLFFIIGFVLYLFITTIVQREKNVDSSVDTIDINKILFLFIPCGGLLLVCAKSAPLFSDRYVAILYPAAILLFFAVLCQVFAKNRKLYVLISISSCLFLIVVGNWGRENMYLFSGREEVLSQTSMRQGRKAVLLMSDDIFWTVPNTYMELKDYEELLVVSYDQINDSEISEIMPKDDIFNVYFFGFEESVEDEQNNRNQWDNWLNKNLPSGQMSYLWDSQYCEVYQVEP